MIKEVPCKNLADLNWSDTGILFYGCYFTLLQVQIFERQINI